MAKDDELYIMKIDYGREYPIHYVTKFLKREHGYYVLSSPNKKCAMKAPLFIMQELREWFLSKQIMYKDYAIQEEGFTIEKADVPKKKRQWHREPWHREPWHSTIKN